MKSSQLSNLITKTKQLPLSKFSPLSSPSKIWIIDFSSSSTPSTYKITSLFNDLILSIQDLKKFRLEKEYLIQTSYLDPIQLSILYEPEHNLPKLSLQLNLQTKQIIINLFDDQDL